MLFSEQNSPQGASTTALIRAPGGGRRGVSSKMGVVEEIFVGPTHISNVPHVPTMQLYSCDSHEPQKAMEVTTRKDVTAMPHQQWQIQWLIHKLIVLPILTLKFTKRIKMNTSKEG